MRAALVPLLISVTLFSAPLASQAKGCLKGAAVGAVAGHFAGRHHLLGAAAGCVIGAHRANKAEATSPSEAIQQRGAPASVSPTSATPLRAQPNSHRWPRHARTR